MLPVSTSDTSRFVPPGHPVDAEVAIILKPASHLERLRWQHAIATAGGRHVSDADAFPIVREALQHTATDDVRPALLEIVDLVEANANGNLETPPDDLGLKWTELLRVVRVAWPALAEAEAARDLWWNLARYQAARFFIVGWEGYAAPFPGRKAGAPLTEADLELIPAADAIAAGAAAINLMTVSDAQKKKFNAPSPST